MKLMKGKVIADEILNNIKQQITKNHYQIKFAIILVGNDFASQKYVNYKMKQANSCNIKTTFHHFEIDCQTSDITKLIKLLNDDITCNGIMVQLPLPKHLDKKQILESIIASKDIDGLRPDVITKLKNHDFTYVPATALAIATILKKYQISVVNKKVIIIGKSKIVGYPLGLLLKQQKADLTWKVKGDNLNDLEVADILIVGAGVKHLINHQALKKDVVIIDVGIHYDKNRKIVGDVDFEYAQKIASYITPVPGGVGPMTIAMLLWNVYSAFCYQNGYSIINFEV